MTCPTRESDENKMSYELILVIFLTFLLFAQLSFVPVQRSVDAQGYATVTVLNSGPEITGIDIISNSTDFQNIEVGKIYEYKVGVSDHNTMTDIESVTLEFWFSKTPEFDKVKSKACNYRFEYREFETVDTELNGTFIQTLPKKGGELFPEMCYADAEVLNGSGSWSFFVRLNRTSSRPYMFVKAAATDTSGYRGEAEMGPLLFEEKKRTYKLVDKTINEIPEEGSQVDMAWFRAAASMAMVVAAVMMPLFIIKMKRWRGRRST